MSKPFIELKVGACDRQSWGCPNYVSRLTKWNLALTHLLRRGDNGTPTCNHYIVGVSCTKGLVIGFILHTSNNSTWYLYCLQGSHRVYYQPQSHSQRHVFRSSSLCILTSSPTMDLLDHLTMPYQQPSTWLPVVLPLFSVNPMAFLTWLAT